MSSESSSQNYAEESAKTKRARQKLKKQMEELENKITPEALKEKTHEIHRWIARHAHHRVILKNKNISLFDENQNTAKLSQRINNIASGLKNDMQSWPVSLDETEGKLSKIFNIQKDTSDSKDS